MQSFEGQSGQFKPYSPFNRKPVKLIENFVRCHTFVLYETDSLISSAILTVLSVSCIHSAAVVFEQSSTSSLCYLAPRRFQFPLILPVGPVSVNKFLAPIISDIKIS